MTPRTDAGRRMLENWWERRTHPPTAARQQAYADFILAIEHEAADSALRRIREGVAGLRELSEANDR